MLPSTRRPDLVAANILDLLSPKWARATSAAIAVLAGLLLARLAGWRGPELIALALTVSLGLAKSSTT